jgi:hypothetical protein
VGAWLSGTSSPFSDVVQAATIGFLLGMLVWQRRRLTPAPPDPAPLVLAADGRHVFPDVCSRAGG